MSEEKKPLNYYILGVIGFLFIVGMIIAVTVLQYRPAPSKPSVIENPEFEKHKQQLQYERDSLQKLIDVEEEHLMNLEQLNDSLKNLQTKIEYVYTQKKNHVDTAHVGYLIREFERLIPDSIKK